LGSKWIQDGPDGLAAYVAQGCNMSHGDHEEQTMKLQNLSKAYQLRPEVSTLTFPPGRMDILEGLQFHVFLLLETAAMKSI